MRKFIVCILLLYPAFSLYAQSSAAVFVPIITGTGGKPEDNDFFYKQLVSEVTYQHFTLAKTQEDAEFSLVGTLSEHPDNTPYGMKQYILRLELKDNKTNKTKSDGELVYRLPDDIKDTFTSLVYTLLYTIPQDSGKDNWRNKWLYAGACAFWTPRIYTAESALMHVMSFSGGIFTEYHVLNYLSVETGFEVATDMIKIYVTTEETFSNVLLEIPVLVKYVMKPGNNFILEPYTGFHLNIPFEKTTVPPPISWLIGIQCGTKAGPGILYIDPRFSIDLGEAQLDPSLGYKDLSFQRYILHLGIGYKIGFFTKR